MVRALTKRLLFFALLPVVALVAACGSTVKNVSPTLVPSPSSTRSGASSARTQPVPSTPPEENADPVLALIALSDQHFAAGQQELELGHPGAAKQEFDKAVSVFMESTYGGRTEPRIREHFDRLIDRISGYEVKALAQGDGFTEKKYEPASIDALLALSATFAPPLAADGKDDLTHTVQSDLQTGEHDIAIPLNQRVLAYIQLFQGRLHDFIQDGMQRGSKYLPMIQNVFRAEGLPLDLAYVPLIESAFKPNALSRAKAKGVWQFMRATGLENGLRQDWYIDERSDPEKATVAAAKYLGSLATMFDGDWHLALASYNGGPGLVQHALKTSKLDDFWQLSANPRLLPRETREYVPMILAAIVIARNPAQYGFDFEPEPVHQYETVTLSRPVDLRLVAEWAETTIDEIQQLNPELRRWTTPVHDSSYSLKVPKGMAAAVNARLAEAGENGLASLKWYSVKAGESLTSVARKLGVSKTDLAEANYLNVTSRIGPGTQLMVPREATALMAARTDRGVPVVDSRALASDTVIPAVASVNSDRVKVVYEVKRGDTLASIARIFKTTVASLHGWNRIAGSTIHSGERLTIYRTARAN